MLVVKRILSVLTCFVAVVPTIAAGMSFFKGFAEFMAGKQHETLSSAIAGLVLVIISIVFFRTAGSLWKDRSVAAQAALPPATLPPANSFMETQPPFPHSFGGAPSRPAPSFAPGDS